MDSPQPHGAAVGAESVVAARPAGARLAWADAVRVGAVTMIFLYHFTGDWVRITGVEPSAVERVVMNSFADWAIAAFVVLSAFSLSLSLARVGAARSLRAFLRRRFTRILIPYWTVAVPFVAVGLLLGEAPVADMWKLPLWLTGLGPVSRATYTPISEAWWYVSLALQVSVAVPLLHRLRGRFGLLPTTGAVLVLNAAALAVTAAAGVEWRYLAQGLVLDRLAEVMIGVAAAGLVLARRSASRRSWAPAAALALVVAVAPLLVGVGMRTDWMTIAFLAALFGVGARFSAPSGRGRPRLAAAAALTYSFYLTHAPVGKYVVLVLERVGVHSVAVCLPLALSVAVLVAWVFDSLSRRVVAPVVTQWFDRPRPPRAGLPRAQ